MPASGGKDLEVRTWQTTYRGPLLLHASRNTSTLQSYGGDEANFPNRGNVVAVANLVDVRQMTRRDVSRSGGEFDPDFFVLELAAITPITPLPTLGKVGIFFTELPDKQRKEIAAWAKKYRIEI